MTRFAWLVFLCGLAIGFAPLLFVMAGSVPPKRGISTVGRVVRVIDGDTIEVLLQPPRVTIRLLDCWAPETRTKDLEEKAKGIAAKQRLTELVDDESVVIFIPTSDLLSDSLTFGRVLGRVWLDTNGDGKLDDVSAVMVEEGHATKTKAGR